MNDIHDIKSRCCKKKLYLKHNDKLGMENTKFRIISQHMNATCVTCYSWNLMTKLPWCLNSKMDYDKKNIKLQMALT
jgi:ATP-dependent Lon protease